MNHVLESVNDGSESHIRQFVSHWFGSFDRLSEESGFFTPFLADDVVISMSEGTFQGHDGFRDWYAIALSLFKSDCQHQLEQVEVQPAAISLADRRATYDVTMRIRLQAQTHSTSPMGGEPVDFLLNETWRVTVNDAGDVLIHEYLVVPFTQDSE
ncbi:nuclear transport factor 2 family protein [Photobacterium japonica]|uniref:nuclear transport factor 2 family protein n=1 Tax=Photobacterium japonica TaxID=2910235 RepID=UPI003D12AFA6